MKSLEAKSLNDLCSLITDGKHGDCQNEPDSGYYFISAKDIIDGKIHYENARQITQRDFAETHRRTDLRPGDILLTNSGTIGRLAIASDCELTPCTTFQKSVAVLKPIKDRILPEFLYYSLAFNRNVLINAARGAAQKNLLLGELKRITILVPSFPIQKRIVDVLSTYESLIENNRRRVQLLTRLANILYKEWFVRLRFSGYEHTKIVDGIPEGWAKIPLGDILTLQRGFDLPLKVRKNGQYPIYASTGVNGYHEVAKVKGPGVVTGRSGSLGTVLYVPEDFWPLNTTLWVKEFKMAGPFYSVHLLASLHLEQYNGGVAVPTLNRNDVHRIEVLHPSESTLKLFDEYIAPLYKQLEILNKQNSKLEKARDLLLPRLMNGEIAV